MSDQKSLSVKVTPTIKESVMAEATEDKVRKPSFDIATAVDVSGVAISLDDNGKLTAVPTNWTPEHKHLGRRDFGDPGLFYEWKGVLLDIRITNLQEEKAKLVEDAAAARSGTPSPSVQLRKFAKMSAQMKVLEAELTAQGIDLTDL